MNIEKTKENMLKVLSVMLDEDMDYQTRLDAYEYLMEDCDEIVDDMLKKSYETEGDTAKMLMEVLSKYPGRKDIFMQLVSFLYRGDDVALFAGLIGAYEDEQGITVLKAFCEDYEPNYYEYQEIKAAIERLGGDFELRQDFSDDPLYRYLKGLDDEDEEDKNKTLFGFEKENKNLLEEDEEENK
ncbi:MAG: hypothetical protein MJ068_03545 [Clostridia bacterium]|nr:hypothetical protein [Clostridia bacterium]